MITTQFNIDELNNMPEDTRFQEGIEPHTLQSSPKTVVVIPWLEDDESDNEFVVEEEEHLYTPPPY